jgi:hypothetical protein
MLEKVRASAALVGLACTCCSIGVARSSTTPWARSLVRYGNYDDVGGLLFLSEINLATPSAVRIVHYARIVVEHAIRGRYISAAQHVAELAWEARCIGGPVVDLLDLPWHDVAAVRRRLLEERYSLCSAMHLDECCSSL